MKSRIFTLIFLLTFISLVIRSSVKAQDNSPINEGASVDVSQTAVAQAPYSLHDQINEIENPNESAIYLIRLTDAPLVSYKGQVRGLTATSPLATGDTKLNANSLPSRAYTNYLRNKHGSTLETIETMLGRPVELIYQYFVTNNGFAIVLTAEEADLISQIPEITFIQKDFERELMTDNGPTWIGAPGLWDGTNVGGSAALTSTQGEGIIVGIIDTGINPSNPSFAEIGLVDGYVHVNPRGAGNYVGVCAGGNNHPDLTCNEKLIGAWGYAGNGNDPVDYDGHGSHTASTVAGNIVNATVNAPTLNIGRQISGVAPHANIIAYGACCTGSDLAAAIDQIVIDGVDVVNYSIGSSGASDAWNDFDTIGFLNARNNGIFVATSAGNAGPGDETVGSPADAPWLLSVGASTHDRQLQNALINMSGGNIAAPANIPGRSFTSGYGPATIVYGGNPPYNNALCGTGPSGPGSNPWPPGTFNGEIVVCDRGTYGRVEKGENVLAAGAGGYILANDAANGNSLSGDPHVLPAVHITYDDGVVLKNWLANGTGQTGTILGTTLDENASYGDIMAGFSSRGANRALPDIIVPSVTAPGVDILAAHGQNDAVVWDFSSGTSMSSPHAAGAAALIKALHPSWTPAEIQSALMTTAVTSILDNDGSTPATPFDMGNGRIDLTQASKAGLLLNETVSNYNAANPATNGDPKTLNLPSMGNSQCFGICSWTRTVNSPLSSSVDWTAVIDMPPGVIISVTPNNFTLPAGGTQVLTIEANVQGATPDQWHFSQITLVPSDSSIPNAHMPVAVYPLVSSSSAETILTKTAAENMVRTGELINYTITVQNPSSSASTFSLLDPIPTNATYVANSATNGLTYNSAQNELAWSGSIPAATMSIDDSSLLSGYQSLSAMGASPFQLPTNADEGCIGVSVPSFKYMGQTYSYIIMSVNGTLEIGDDSQACSGYINRRLPTSIYPHNLLAPFWDDLDLRSSGNWYIMAGVPYNGRSHTVYEWENVPRYGEAGSSMTFQIWVEEGTDNIWFAYGSLTGTTNSSSIGAQNSDGSEGVSYLFNGSGTVPNGTVDLLIDYDAHPEVFTFQVRPDSGPEITNTTEVTVGATTVNASATTAVGDVNIWLGNNTIWHNSGNWSLNRTPFILDSAVIPTTPGGGNMPVLSNDAAVYDLTVETDASVDLGSSSLSAENNVTNNGTLSQQATNVPSGSTTEFLRIQNSSQTTDRYLGVNITPTSGDMGSTTVTIRGNSDCTTNDPTDTVDRCFDITPTNQETANVRFYYLNTEADEHNPAAVEVWHWGGSFPWTAAGSVSSRGSAGSYEWVEATGITGFSPFVLADNVPTAVTLQTFSASPTTTSLVILLSMLLFGTVAALILRRQTA